MCADNRSDAVDQLLMLRCTSNHGWEAALIFDTIPLMNRSLARSLIWGQRVVTNNLFAHLFLGCHNHINIVILIFSVGALQVRGIPDVNQNH